MLRSDDEPREVPLLSDAEVPEEYTAPGLTEDHPWWPRQLAFWAIALLTSIAGLLLLLIFPDIAIAAFNGGVDPCVHSPGSPACNRATDQLSTMASIFQGISSIVGLLLCPFIGLVADMVGINRMIFGCMAVGLLSACTTSSVILFNVPVLFAFGASELLALFPAVMLFQIFISEHTRPERRLIMFARLGAVTGLEAIGGILVAAFAHTKTVAAVAVCFQAVAALLCACLPRSPRRSAQAPPAAAALPAPPGTSPVRLVRKSVVNCSALRRLFKDHVCRLVMICCMLSLVVEQGCFAIIYLSLKNEFGADHNSLAPLFLAITVGRVIVQVFVAAPLSRLLGVRNVMLLCACLFVPALAMRSWAGSLAQAYPGVLLLNCSSCLLNAAGRALVINIATAGDEKGVGGSMGMFTSTMMVSFIIGPQLFNFVYRQSLQGAWKHAPWLLASVIMIVVAALLWQIPKSAITDSGEVAAQPDVAPRPDIRAPGATWRGASAS